MTGRLFSWLAVSPRRKAPRTCGDREILAGRGASQMGWYHFVSQFVEGQTVLDVGCGSGEGLKVLSERATDALGIDLDDRLRRPDVHVEIKPVEAMPDKSFDVVVCLDVIEHIEADRAFVLELARVARNAVFVTTPNYTLSRNKNPYHVREYTPREFERLFHGLGNATLYAGTAKGAQIVPLTRRLAYQFVNDLYAWRPTLLAAKIVKRLLGVKVWAHQAALVRIPESGSGTAGAAHAHAA
jgi:SAM-dependent methyltransferase